MELFKDKLIRFSDAFESVRIFITIRKALTTMIPIIIIGAITLMLSSLPIPIYQSFIKSVFDGKLVILFNLIKASTLEMLSIYMVVVLSYQLGSTFISDTKEIVIVGMTTLAGYFILSGNVTSGKLPTNFDGSNFFTVILCSVITCYYFKRVKPLLSSRQSYYALNSDSGFTTSIRMLVPAAILLVAYSLFTMLISIVFNVQGIQGLFSKGCQLLFTNVLSGYPAMLLYTILVQILWFFGVHGSNMLQPILQENYMEVGEHIFSKSFYDTFVNIGGSGMILCLVIAIILTAKTRDVKYINSLGTLPALFNISEPITLGLPLLFNPIFFIPFLLVPIVSGAIAYFATYIGLVPVVSHTVEWTTPVFFSGYYAVGDYSGTVLQFVIICVGVAIYIPFIKIYEEQLVRNTKKQVSDLVAYMEECEKAQKAPHLLDLKDQRGQTAKALAIELAEAIEKEEVFFKYQPQMDNNNQCIGCEALVRWNHNLIGNIYPPLLVQLAIESGELENIERSLVRNACELIRSVETLTHQKVKVSINTTVASFMRDGFEEMIASALYRYGVSPTALCIELTENEVYTSNDVVEEKLLNLQNMGHKLIIDDFGMGHTSLKYLQKNRFDTVKLDGSLTRGIETNEVNQQIIRSICELGHSLGFHVIAEYVEEDLQKKILGELGCTYYQGYLYSPAIDKNDFIQYFTSHNFFAPFN